MRHRFSRFCAVAIFAISLAACDSRMPEQRVNEAMPIAQAVQVASESLLKLAGEGGHDVAPLAAELETRKQLRVLECAPAYKPGLFDDRSNIAAALKDKAACFRAQDDELLAWVMQRRVSVLLAAPPLSVKPAALPTIPVPVTPMDRRFARNAGVLFTRNLLSGEYAIVQVATGQVLASGKARAAGSLSANGRLFVTSQQSGDQKWLEVRETATGNVLQTLPGAVWIEWIRDIGALITPARAPGSFDVTQLTFRDVVTGLDTPLSVPSYHGLLPMPAGVDRLVLIHQGGLIALKVEKTAKGWTARLDPPYAATGYHIGFDAGVTADGKQYVIALGTNLRILDFESGAMRTASTQPFVVLNLVPTNDPDRVLLTGHYGPPATRESERLLYSLSRGTAAVVPIAENQEYIDWEPEYRSLIRSANGTIFPVTVPAAGPEMDFASIVALRKPELEARALANAVSPTFDPRGTPVAATLRQDAGTQTVIAGPVAELAKKARVFAIGVYEGKRYPGDARGGNVRVNVMRTKGPIILVLASYEGVRWVVTADPGAEVGAILVSGYTQAEVMGVQAPVHHIGSNYSYGSDSGGGNRSGLDADVRHWTGKGIDRFQGKYTGDMFVILE